MDHLDSQKRPTSAGANDLFLGSFLQAWLLTAVGGALCGFFSMGLATMVLFVFAMPIGLFLGTMLGLPLGLVLAGVFTRFANPPTDRPRFTAWVERVGVVVALLVSTPTNVAFGLGFHDLPPSNLAMLMAAACILMSTGVGRVCGRTLAEGHLRRLDRAGVTAATAPASSPRSSR